MSFRAAWLWVVLAGIAGCEEWGAPYPWRVPCEEDDPETCCPPGSHQYTDLSPRLIICVADELPCADAGADAGACPDAGSDAP